MRTALSLLVAFLVCMSAEAAYAGVLWQENGASCVPDAATRVGGQYTTSSGYVRISSSSTGTINFYCPVSIASSTAVTGISLLYYSSLNNTHNLVSAAYYKMNRETGVLTLIAVQPSNGSGCPANRLSQCSSSSGFSDTIDNADYVYFVAVTLTNNSSAYAQTFYNIQLSD
jgi:hypothetical protein